MSSCGSCPERILNIANQRQRYSQCFQRGISEGLSPTLSARRGEHEGLFKARPIVILLS
jgi:hypothetical protein